MDARSEVQVDVDMEGRKADVSAPHGCPACEGPVALRVMHGHAWIFCGACVTLSPAKVQLTDDGLVVTRALAVS